LFGIPEQLEKRFLGLTVLSKLLAAVANLQLKGKTSG
jgi:hypothetical protein